MVSTMHHSGFTTDIGGLREQIKENATLLFPGVVEHHLSTHPASTNKHDAFKIFIRATEGLLRRKYQAILTRGVRRTIDGREIDTIDVAAMGESAGQVCDAVLNLLEVVSEGVTKSLLSFEGVGSGVLAEGRGRYLDRGVGEMKRVA